MFCYVTPTYRHLARPCAVALADSVLGSSRQEVAVLTAVHQGVAKAWQVHPHHVHMQRALWLFAGVGCRGSKEEKGLIEPPEQRGGAKGGGGEVRLCVRMHSGCVPLQVRSGWQVLEEEPWIKCPGWHWKDTTLPTCAGRRTGSNICEREKWDKKKTTKKHPTSGQNVKANRVKRSSRKSACATLPLKVCKGCSCITGSYCGATGNSGKLGRRLQELLSIAAVYVASWSTPALIQHIYCASIIALQINKHLPKNILIQLFFQSARGFVWPQLEAQHDESLLESDIITSFKVQGTKQTPTHILKISELVCSS